MSYITINTDIDININDISDHDIIEIIEERIAWYKRRIEYDKKFTDGRKKELAKFISDVRTASGNIEMPTILPSTLEDELYQKEFERLKKKYSLTQIENL